MKLALLFLFSLIKLVFSDQVLVYSPPVNSSYFVKDIMDIRYKVHPMGMIKIWSTSTSLIHLNTNTTIDNFPNLKWSIDEEKSVNDTVHTTWSIPPALPSGSYYINFTSNGTSMCSRDHNGSAPFVRCNFSLYEFRFFQINNQSMTM